MNPPYCFYTRAHVTYTVVEHQENAHGITATLRLTKPSGHPGDEPTVDFQATYETEDRLKITFKPRG